jgi:hypothetical protein
MPKKLSIPNIPVDEQTSTVNILLVLLEQFAERIQQQDETILQLKNEILVLKGEKEIPTFKPSKMDKETDKKDNGQDENGKNKKRPGSKKR